MRTFRSILLPLKAVVLNLVSLAAVMGLATWFWQEGNGSHAVFGVEATGAMTFWLPPLIFAFLFGLSMDYEVFILSPDARGVRPQRVDPGGRGPRPRTHRPPGHLGGADPVLRLRRAGLGARHRHQGVRDRLGVGILLDATIVRAVLVPSLVVLFGRWNWWLPRSGRQDHAGRAVAAARARRARSRSTSTSPNRAG